MNQFVDDGALRIRPLAVLNDIENQRLENSKIEEVLSAVLREIETSPAQVFSQSKTEMPGYKPSMSRILWMKSFVR